MFKGIDKFLYYQKDNSFKKSMFILFIIIAIFIACCISESIENKKHKNTAEINEVRNQ